MTMDLSGFVQKQTKIEIGTKEFTFTELTLADLAEFRAEMQKKRKAFNQQRREQLLEVAEKIGNIEPMELLKYIDKPLSETEIEEEMETTEGLGFLVFLSLRTHHPGISRDDVLKIVTPKYAEQISKAIFMIDDTEKKTAVIKTERKSATLQP